MCEEIKCCIVAYMHYVVHHKTRKFLGNKVALWVESKRQFITKIHKFRIPDENGKALGLYSVCINISDGQSVVSS